MSEEELKPLPSKGWAAMIRKVCEVDPMLCPKCGGMMKVISFITDFQVVDRIIDHLGLTFVADKPPPAHVLPRTHMPRGLPRGNLWLGFQKGAATLWSRAGSMPRPRMRACEAAEGR